LEGFGESAMMTSTAVPVVYVLLDSDTKSVGMTRETGEALTVDGHGLSRQGKSATEKGQDKRQH
jgi:hypothetical protein